MLTFRQASEQDLEQITDWTLKLHHHEDDASLAVNEQFNQHLKQWLSLEIANPNYLFLIAEINQQPIGFIAATSVLNDNGFLRAPIKGVVQLIWVDTEYRQQNIASQLVDEVQKCFESIGITYIECSYTINNNEAQKFWQKKHFQPFSISARKLI